MKMEPTKNIIFYGDFIDPQFLPHIADYVHNEMSEMYEGKPIAFDSNTIFMSPDLTMRIWGQPNNIHAWVIEIAHYPRTLN
jgi:hypothetical protein